MMFFQGLNKCLNRLVPLLFLVVVSTWITLEGGLMMYAKTSLWDAAEVVVRTKTRKPTTTRPSVEEAAEIPLNPNATTLLDVRSIRHYAEESKIVVTLNKGTRCPRPYLMGRLSGPVLVKIAAEDGWKYNKHQNTTFTVEGTYRVPIPGTYTLEIVVIFCDHIFYDYIERVKNFNYTNSNSSEMTQLRDFDIKSNKSYCVEDPTRHRLTADHAFIQVAASSNNNNNNNSQSPPTTPPSSFSQDSSTTVAWNGYWYSVNPTNYTKVFTRYQTKECYDLRGVKPEMKPPLLLAECNKQTAFEQFDAYRFQWQHHRNEPLTPQRLSQPRPTTICLVGKSHSQRLRGAADRIGLRDYNVTIDKLDAHFPNDVYPALLTKDKLLDTKRCESIVIGVGQWAAGGEQGPAKIRNVEQYYQEISTMVRGLLQEGGVTQPIYLRSIHYNGLKYMVNTCPPQDLRNPMVIDAYNAVLQQVAQDFNNNNVQYIDTNFLVAPFWDSAADWNHLPRKVFMEEIKYLVASVLRVGPTPSRGEKASNNNETQLK